MKKSHFLSIGILDRLYKLQRSLINFANIFLFYLTIGAIILVFYDIGFPNKAGIKDSITLIFNFFITIYLILFSLRLFLGYRKEIKVHSKISNYLIFTLIVVIFFFRILVSETFYLNHPGLAFFRMGIIVHAFAFLTFFYEFSGSSLTLFNKTLNPALIFTFSFVLLILFGAGLLMMPMSTHSGISFIDALFTSTSAVCVTGLTAVDTATSFTALGKGIILILIQLGGLGVMTFTSFFGIFFKGESSFTNQLVIKDMINESNLSQVFKTLLKIIVFTLVIELIGAVVLFFILNHENLGSSHNRFWVAIFHSISAFCNAGFSTYSGNLYDPEIRNAYGFHWVIGFLVVFGGIGFPILFNYYTLSKHYIKNKIKQSLGFQQYYSHKPHVIAAGTRLVVYTTLILIVSGMVLFFVTEYNNTLKGLSIAGKITGAFLGSVAPRTAGFNTVDTSAILESTALITLLLMWIGASPGSTGGGIKTTTFAVSVLNFVGLARGKEKVEYKGVEISNETIRRSFAIMVLSLLVIGLSVFFVGFFDPQFSLLKIIFECVSAFSTVGLSLGITADLSSASKFVIVITMLIGRVGMFTILVGIIKKAVYKTYRYPSENLFIT